MHPSPNLEDDPRKYVQLANELRRQITEGTLRPRQRVPSITELAAERGWSREPCSMAMQVLADEGLVGGRLGWGITWSSEGQPQLMTAEIADRHRR